MTAGSFSTVESAILRMNRICLRASRPVNEDWVTWKKRSYALSRSVSAEVLVERPAKIVTARAVRWYRDVALAPPLCGGAATMVALHGRCLDHGPRAGPQRTGRPRRRWEESWIRLVWATWCDVAESWPCHVAAELVVQRELRRGVRERLAPRSDPRPFS